MALAPAAGALLLALAGTLVMAGKPVNDGGEWPRVCPGGVVCFRHPPGLVPVSGQPADSVAGRFKGQGLSLSYDLGPYASDFSELVNPSVEPVRVDGRRGEILVSGPLVALRVPQVDTGIRFAMVLRFEGAVDQQLGRRIFESIEFQFAKE